MHGFFICHQFPFSACQHIIGQDSAVIALDDYPLFLKEILYLEHNAHECARNNNREEILQQLPQQDSNKTDDHTPNEEPM